MELKDKKVLVVGLARSGVSAIKLCCENGAIVTVQDSKKEEQLSDILENLKCYNVKYILGRSPIDIVVEQNLIVVSPGVPTDLEFIKKAKENNIPVISEIELSYQFCPVDIIGITGTNGKTTTTTLVGEIIKDYLPESQVVGNIGVPFSEMISEMKKDTYAVAELSSFQLETIVEFKPKISAILNITPDHLNRHKTLENYIEAKERIFENQIEQDYCILNYDDKTCRSMENKTKAQIIFFSRKHKLDQGVYLDNNIIKIKWNEEELTVCGTNELKILGNHSVENVMAAVAICYAAGIPIKNIVNKIKEFQGVEHRIEFVGKINDVYYYNDSKATNPDAAIVGINAMVRPTILIGGGMNKGSDYTEWIKSFNGKVKQLILFGETAKEILRTAEELGFNKNQLVNDLEEAVLCATKIADKEDCVLLSPACASWDMFESYEERGRLFKEYILRLKR